MCIRQQSAPAPATTAAISGSPRSAVTSLTSVAPASSAGAATAAFEVSIEIWAPAPRATQPLDHRHHAAQLLGLGDTGAAPGRVDSPPMSRIVAPSASSSSPCAIAASAVEVAARRPRTSPA